MRESHVSAVLQPPDKEEKQALQFDSGKHCRLSRDGSMVLARRGECRRCWAAGWLGAHVGLTDCREKLVAVVHRHVINYNPWHAGVRRVERRCALIVSIDERIALSTIVAGLYRVPVHAHLLRTSLHVRDTVRIGLTLATKKFHPLRCHVKVGLRAGL